nr:MAG TPA: hypothetical protein [Caudoviricetes sp.]
MKKKASLYIDRYNSVSIIMSNLLYSRAYVMSYSII